MIPSSCQVWFSSSFSGFHGCIIYNLEGRKPSPQTATLVVMTELLSKANAKGLVAGSYMNLQGNVPRHCI
jgi:hypothetical protein